MAKDKNFILTIAGSDSSSGAGIQSDLKTFHNHGLYGLSVITAVTAQNTLGIQSAVELSKEIVESQLKSVFEDFDIRVAKTGMLSSAKIVETVSIFLRNKASVKVIVDPVIISKSGFRMLDDEGIDVMKAKLFPLAYLVAPNISEAERISGIEIKTAEDIEEAAKAIYNTGCKNVLVKGGHMPESTGIEKGADFLFNGERFFMFRTKFMESQSTHGIGCVFTASIASNLVLGNSLKKSIAIAKAYLVESLKRSQKIGKGIGPVEQV